MEITSLSLGPLGGFAWCPVGTAFEMGIAKPVGAAFCHEQRVFPGDEIPDELIHVGIEHQCPKRHLDPLILATPAGALTPHAASTIFPVESSRATKIRKRIQPFIHNKVHAAPVSTITPIRSATGQELLTAKTQAPIAAIPGFNPNNRFIDKLHNQNITTVVR